jgi:hypothetical protein
MPIVLKNLSRLPIGIAGFLFPSCLIDEPPYHGNDQNDQYDRRPETGFKDPSNHFTGTGCKKYDQQYR